MWVYVVWKMFRERKAIFLFLSSFFAFFSSLFLEPVFARMVGEENTGRGKHELQRILPLPVLRRREETKTKKRGEERESRKRGEERGESRKRTEERRKRERFFSS